MVTAAADPAKVPIAWQHHQAKFTYFGLTTLYVCDSLEAQVSRILIYLGARADLKVTASCSNPAIPSHTAVITVDFDTPVPAEGTAADGVMGQWIPVGLEAGHPHFIGAGDCELIDDMQDLLTRNFSLRKLDYSTSCFPNSLTLHDFAVKGEALKAAVSTR